jgi:hypothetical protein
MLAQTMPMVEGHRLNDLRRKAGGFWEYRCVAGVEGRPEKKDRGDAADYLCEVSGFFLAQGPA